MIERRTFLRGLGAAVITAPAIVEPLSIMPVKVMTWIGPRATLLLISGCNLTVWDDLTHEQYLEKLALAEAECPVGSIVNWSTNGDFNVSGRSIILPSAQRIGRRHMLREIFVPDHARA